MIDRRLTRRTMWQMLAGATMLSAVAAPSFAATPVRTADARPNILLIVLDDVGFSDFGAYGSEIHTPNIDAIAKRGLRYNRFDTKAICSATRAALLTGRNNQTVGMSDLPYRGRQPNPNAGTQLAGELSQDADTLADALHGAGYTTLAVGKWHLTPGFEGGPGGGRAGEGSGNSSWPLQRGFDHYYGFLSGWTDQYRPKLVRDNTPIATPKTPTYHLSEDLADQAIHYVDQAAGAGKPFFMYLALGAAHAPIQAPRTFIDRYKGQYDKGWDAVRAERFARMKQLGIIPADTVLPARVETDAAWTSLTDQERKVFARFMETYAGFLDHADVQIGRVIDSLKQKGMLDNTVIMVMSDNGAAGEAGPNGGFQQPYNDRTPIAEMEARLDELGGPTTESSYQRPWAMASNTPLRRYKVWPYAGGVRAPLIVSWPKEIRDFGAIRPQPVDVIDLAPTLADIGHAKLGVKRGASVIPVAGTSIQASFASAAAKAGRPVQYFELRGNRAIRAGEWRALAMHRPGTPFESDKWELFNTDADYAEARDLAASQPDKLKEMQALWWSEARKYSNPPLVDRRVGRDRGPDEP